MQKEGDVSTHIRTGLLDTGTTAIFSIQAVIKLKLDDTYYIMELL